ncbi:MAG: hypothetical protein ACRELE_11505 [Gemmatimonadales bacterium]
MKGRSRSVARGVMVSLVSAALLMFATGCHRPVNLFALRVALDTSGRRTISPDTAFKMDRTGVTQAGACTGQTLSLADSAAHGYSDSISVALPRNGFCTYQISEYHDVQQLRINNNADYGPLVWSFASPWLGNYTQDKDFNSLWLNVAIVKVDAPRTAVLAAPYRDLRLSGGFNCVFLYHDTSVSPHQWRAAVVPAIVDLDCGNLKITASNIVPVQDEQKFPDAGDYPAVTRFIESADTRTFIGVRCGNRWCAVGAKFPDLVHTSALENLPGAGTSPQWRIKGWFDEQHLAVASGTAPAHPQQLAALVPSDSLSLFDSTAYDHNWKLVATAYFPDTPAGKYGEKSAAGYGWVAGFNNVWLRSKVVSRPSRPDTVEWMSVIGDTTKPQHVKAVVRTDHLKDSLPVPWTARWRWVPNDEQMWVACLMGCCMVKPIDR